MLPYKITTTVNVDQYVNVNRQFRIDFEPLRPDLPPEHVIVSSGTDGIAIRVKGHVQLNSEMIAALLTELHLVEKFSAEAEADMREYWDIKNQDYIAKYKKKYGSR